jgi:hypothetical protein
MSIACMNDPRPITDRDPTSATYGQQITDPAYNPAYSNFCYEQPFMPGFTTYMDTPVVPVQAFADRYNLPDAEYPDHTPVIRKATFAGQKGPWSPAVNGVGNVTVTSPGAGYSGAATVNFTPSSGGAAGTAVMGVTTYTVTNKGAISSGAATPYSPPTVVLAGGGTNANGAAATACLGVASVTVPGGGIPTAGGGPVSVSFAGAGAGNGATATATTAGNGNARRVTAINVTNGGCGFTAVPTVRLNNNNSTATAVLGLASITSTNATSVGSGYTSQPTVSFTGGSLTNESATAFLGVVGVTVTNAGNFGSTLAQVNFTGGGATINARGTVTTSVTAATSLILTAFGERGVQNPQYTGPSGATQPYASKTITRTYDFGHQCTSVGGSCAAISSVTIDGKPATINSWIPGPHGMDTINLSVPAGLSKCRVQQIATTPGAADPPASYCGQVVIVSGTGQQSFDAITVTVGGNPPIVVEPDCATSAKGCSNTFVETYPNPLQTAIDQAKPGDLILVDAGTYRENLIMWKPVRLQGIGAGAVTINADAHPAGKMDAWRRRIDCLFGLTLQGAPNVSNSSFDSTRQYSCPDSMYFRADRLPFEGFLGWDASSNGNLAQVLQEP